MHGKALVGDIMVAEAELTAKVLDR